MSSYLLFENYLNKFVAVTFTALIFAETFNIIIFVPRFSKWMLFSIVSTILLYIITTFVFSNLFGAHFFEWKFFTRVFYIFLISWLPVFICTKLNTLRSVDITDLY